MDPALRNLPPPKVAGDWETIVELTTTCSIQSWWDSFSKWMNVSIYEQVHKIEIFEIWVDGNQVERTAPYTLAELVELAKIHTLPTEISYKRRIYPKDYQRKAEVDDCVTLFLHENRLVYRPYIPENDPTRLAYFYLQAYAFSFELMKSPTLYDAVQEVGPKEDETGAADGEPRRVPVVLKVIPFEDKTLHLPEKLKKVASFYVKYLDKWDKSFKAGGYVKRVYHDVVVPLDLFTSHYRRLKLKYDHWVTEWEESTDPQKFVFEDVGIAAFLISLWELQEDNKFPSFVDIGCGNGFLVYLLTMEGFSGRGIDIVKRKIWAKYPPSVQLTEASIDPPNDTYEEDWILANHSDELTPWVPFIASRNNRKFFLLPCCEWNFDTKFTNRTKALSRYEYYLEYIKTLTAHSGYKVDVEHLRIPSTRNIAIIGQTRTIDPTNPEEVQRIQQQQDECLKRAKYSKFSPRVAPPKVHSTPKKRDRKSRDKGTQHPSLLAANPNGAVAEPSAAPSSALEPTDRKSVV